MNQVFYSINLRHSQRIYLWTSNPGQNEIQYPAYRRHRQLPRPRIVE